MGDDLCQALHLAALGEHLLLNIPERARQIDVVVVRVVKALDLVPEVGDTVVGIGADLFKRRQIVDELTVLKDRDEQLLGGERCV